MREIYKYKLEKKDVQRITMPAQSLVRSVGLDPQGEMCIWVEIPDTRNRTEARPIYVVGTGREIPKEARVYHGSLVQGQFVWHIYGE